MQVSQESENLLENALKQPWLAVCTAILLFVLGRTLIRAYLTPLRDIPGPWSAKFTRLWLFKAIASRSFQKINLELHRKHGKCKATVISENIQQRVLEVGESTCGNHLQAPLFALHPTNIASMTQMPPRFFIEQLVSLKRYVLTTSSTPSIDWMHQSPRYLAWGVPTDEQNLFSATNIIRHAERRRQTATLYQWSTLTAFEPQLDALTQGLLGHMTKLADSGRETQLNHWFHYYALDAIGTIAVCLFPCCCRCSCMQWTTNLS